MMRARMTNAPEQPAAAEEGLAGYLTPAEYAARYGVSLSAVYAWLRAGAVQGVRLRRGATGRWRVAPHPPCPPPIIRDPDPREELRALLRGGARRGLSPAERERLRQLLELLEHDEPRPEIQA